MQNSNKSEGFLLVTWQEFEARVVHIYERNVILSHKHWRAVGELPGKESVIVKERTRSEILCENISLD